MKITWSFGVLLVFVNCVILNAQNTPVLIHYKNVQNGNVITVGHSLNSKEFEKLLHPIQNSVKVISVNQLSVEDLRGFLSSLTSKNFHFEPMVNDATEALKEYSLENKIKINSDNFDAKHLELAIKDFQNSVAQNVYDAVILVGAEPKVLSRSKRAILATSNVSVSVFGDKCAALFESISVIDLTKGLPTPPEMFLNLSSQTFVCNNSTSNLSIQFQPNTKIANFVAQRLDLVFDNTGLYWGINNYSKIVTDKGDYGIQYYGAPYGMETPQTFSFVCTRTYFQLYNASTDARPLAKVSLYIEKLQIQTWLMNATETVYTFGKVNYCQGFFSSGIWMAITATLLLATILAFGVSFLFSIKTMDKFDDPKGKPLSIALEK